MVGKCGEKGKGELLMNDVRFHVYCERAIGGGEEEKKKGGSKHQGINAQRAERGVDGDIHYTLYTIM